MTSPVKQYREKAQVVLETGMSVDLGEAWRKLITSQFGGSPGRAFGELIQNFLDSYPSTTPWSARRGEIVTVGNSSIALTDYGEGMSLARLKLLLTLGGTDKRFDPTKIGTFGMGFFSIFNPALGTTRVVVATRCEHKIVELEFRVVESGRCPEIKTAIVAEEIAYSTRITVFFDNPRAVGDCLHHARKCLYYYPCTVTIDGRPCSSLWERGGDDGSRQFQNHDCHGLVHGGESVRETVEVLCKYEPVMKLSVPMLATGGHDMAHDLRDYRKKEMACVPRKAVTINSNTLNVTISRDSFRLDRAYERLVQSLAVELLGELDVLLAQKPPNGLVVANQYIFAARLRDYLDHQGGSASPAARHRHHPAIAHLADAKVYRLSGQEGSFSLSQLKARHSRGLPLFFSSNESRVSWLGGAYRHDFVVLPPPCWIGGGALQLYEDLFTTLFGLAVNLETVERDEPLQNRLVAEGIVSEAMLRPDCTVLEQAALTPAQAQLLEEVGLLLALPALRQVVAGQLGMAPDKLEVVFFEARAEGVHLATGLFDGSGLYLGGRRERAKDAEQAAEDGPLTFGLNLGHQLIRILLNSRIPHRVCFLLPVLAAELARTRQGRAGVTTTRKEVLAAELRRAMLVELLAEV